MRCACTFSAQSNTHINTEAHEIEVQLKHGRNRVNVDIEKYLFANCTSARMDRILLHTLNEHMYSCIHVDVDINDENKHTHNCM